jgi:hypothetical protein
VISRRQAMRGGAIAALAAAAAPALKADAPPADLDHLVVRHRRVRVNGVQIF